MSLELKEVSRTFNGTPAINNISFRTKSGEIVGLLGTSGCGKSTILRSIAGLDTRYYGEITINQKRTKGIQASIGYIFQEPRLLPWLNVMENVTFGLTGKKINKKQRGLDYLKSVGLSQKENLYPKQLSGGMAQRVAIARALVTSPEILLLDEPFSALDAFTKMQLQDLLLSIWSKYQTTMVLVTHDIDEALFLCDRILILRGQPGTVAAEIVLEQSKPRLRGSQEMATLKAEILEILQLERGEEKSIQEKRYTV
ncbi:ABC transporter ATP-binding protein [Oceanobacillus kimchii]|uniref:ABC transporter ATP-binding protein n=1 Tax=Oceanobacillus kimchii TaxID=746691 RepID=UPI000345AFBE|nr:ABC transporter ATP-binding protein [Oceanobacillus kimchii]